MAKQRYGINDGYRGTVGTVIGYMWRGRWCLRARPRSVRNPRTEKQQHNRELFKQMVFLASAFKQALRQGHAPPGLGRASDGVQPLREEEQGVLRAISGRKNGREVGAADYQRGGAGDADLYSPHPHPSLQGGDGYAG